MEYTRDDLIRLLNRMHIKLLRRGEPHAPFQLEDEDGKNIEVEVILPTPHRDNNIGDTLFNHLMDEFKVDRTFLLQMFDQKRIREQYLAKLRWTDRISHRGHVEPSLAVYIHEVIALITNPLNDDRDFNSIVIMAELLQDINENLNIKLVIGAAITYYSEKSMLDLTLNNICSELDLNPEEIFPLISQLKFVLSIQDKYPILLSYLQIWTDIPTLILNKITLEINRIDSTINSQIAAVLAIYLYFHNISQTDTEISQKEFYNRLHMNSNDIAQFEHFLLKIEISINYSENVYQTPVLSQENQNQIQSNHQLNPDLQLIHEFQNIFPKKIGGETDFNRINTIILKIRKQFPDLTREQIVSAATFEDISRSSTINLANFYGSAKNIDFFIRTFPFLSVFEKLINNIQDRLSFAIKSTVMNSFAPLSSEKDRILSSRAWHNL